MQILHNIDLKPRHTLATSATADTLVIIEHPDELVHIQANDHLLGSGSNTIFIGNVKQRLVHLAFSGIELMHEDAESVTLRALAGTLWHSFVQYTVEQNWYGLENLAAIPGTVGAAPIQNIGAYGVECQDHLVNVEVYDREQRQITTLTHAECEFSYRQSRFKRDWRNRYIITAVSFRLLKRGKLKTAYPGIPQGLTTPRAMFEAICAVRQSKLPDPAELPNAGSFFHNPIVTVEKFAELSQKYPNIPYYSADDGQVKLSAGWLIEQSGLKGVYHGAVGMYEKHALILINKGGSGAEILKFATYVQATVAEKFGVALIIEPIAIGETHG